MHATSASVNTQPNNLAAALALAQGGWRIFPLAPGSKIPRAGSRGLLDATDDEAIIERWWTDCPTSNIGLSTENLVVIDVDGRDNPWLSDDSEKLESLRDAISQWTPKGKHLIFWMPSGKSWRNSAGKLAERVDVRAGGGYIAAAPSETPQGKYEWIGQGLPANAADLAEPPAWLVAELDRISSGSGSTATATATPAKIISGQRNDALTSIAGVMRRIGLDAEEIKSALVAVNERRCSPPLDEREVERIASSVSRYEPDQVSEILTFGLGAIEETPVDPRDVPAEIQLPDPGEFPLEIIEDVPGLMRDVMCWNLRSAHKPQPVLALGGALSLMSALTGRKIEDERGTRTNLYSLALAPTGAGKERAREANATLLSELGVTTPNGIGSSSGLISQLERQPSTLFQLDEFSKLIRTMRDPRGGGHRYQIPERLLSLYTCPRGVYVGDCYADMENQKIIQDPHCVLHATSTIEDFLDAITLDDVRGGLLPRFMLFMADNAPRNHDVIAVGPSAHIRDGIRSWHDFKSQIGDTHFKARPTVVKYSSEAREFFRDKIDGWDDLAQGGMGELWTRAAEKVSKLALLLAASREGPAVAEVALGDVEWGAAVVEWGTRKMAYLAGPRVGRNEQERISGRVFEIIRAAGGNGISRSVLTQRTRWLDARARESVLADLHESRMIVQRFESTKTNRATKYVACVHDRANPCNS